MPHGQIARQTADAVGHRLCRKHAAHAEIPAVRQQQSQGHNNERLAQEREEHRVFRPAQRAERTLTGILECHHHKAEKVNVQRRNSRRDQFRVLIENADEQGREKRDQYPDKHGVPDSDLRHKTDSVSGALVQPRAVVVADGGRCTVRDGEHRRLCDLAHGVKYGHDADVQIAAEIAQSSIARHLHERIRERHDKAGDAEHGNALDTVPVRPETAEIQL